MGKTLIERLWGRSYTITEAACWLWGGCVDRGGYGWLWVSGKKQLVHRLSWIEHNGPIPAGMCVLHKCDVRNCWNPGHLFLGTHVDNSRDRENKGRGNQPKGEASGRAKLNDDDVLSIRKAYASGDITQRALAKSYGVCHATIGVIARRENWRHI